MAASLDGAAPISRHNGSCLDGSSDVTLRVHLPPGSGNDFSWAPLASVGSAALSFVISKALLALAPGCVAPSAVSPNADSGPGTPRNIWVGRVDELTLPLALDKCGCGLAIFVSGSGGITGDNLRMMRHLAALGYSTVAPDTMAGAPAGSSGAYPRHREPVADLARQVGLRDSYWCANEVYTSSCPAASAGGAYPACFSSNAEHIRYDPAGWAAFYERVYSMRKLELDTLVEGFAGAFGTPGRLFLHGNSEGAMVASRYSHPLLEQLHLRGRILTAWSCEYVYFVSCRAHAAIGSPNVPVLNLLSADDPFFAANSSIAAAVSRPGGGYGQRPSGSCARQMRSQGVRGAAIKLLQPYHDTLEMTGSLYRHMLRRFLRDPRGAFDHRTLLSFGDAELPSTLCDAEKLSDGVLSATCRSLEEYVTPQPASAYNSTRCGWSEERIRPQFLSFEHLPEQCITAAGASDEGGSAAIRYGMLGAALGAATCCLLGLLVAVYVRCAHPGRWYRVFEDQEAPPREVAIHGASLTAAPRSNVI